MPKVVFSVKRKIKLGIAGYPLGHTFSKKYFLEKFEKLNLTDTFSYDVFPVKELADLKRIMETDPDLLGFNVTIPHKEGIIEHLDALEGEAAKIRAVNVVCRRGREWVGYNTDQAGFRESLDRWLAHRQLRALILGTGGSSLAVQAALEGLAIPFQLVSRSPSHQQISYGELENQSSYLQDHLLIINTTPLGMHPSVQTCPPIPFDRITPQHHLFDLVYNPEQTMFLQKGARRGARTRGGLEMLHLQADYSWKIWRTHARL